MYLFGTILIVTGLAMALLSTVSYVQVLRGKNAALAYGRAGVYGALMAMSLVWTFLILLFLARRYDVAYVNNYSSNDLDFFFTIAASWAGQPGSFAIWALWGVLAAPLLIRRSRHFEPYVLAVFMFIQAALMLFILFVNPFVPLTDPNTGAALTPSDGRGLNPLLHNFWMIIHPPILFVGFSLAAVPFAFALGGLLRRDYDTWIERALPWTLAAWAFLGLALLLGGYWAYETLGWGGYWGWDPVENSSLVPWLMLTALLHGMILQRTHGGLRRSNFALAIAAYILVFYSTFLTRSGVLSNFSVHSFVAEGILGVLLAYLLLIIVGSIALFALRWRDIPTSSLSARFFSRDSFFVLAILTFLVLAVVIGLGTSMPVISAIPGVGHYLQGVMGQAFSLDDGTLYNPNATPFSDGRFGLTAEFFQRSTPPLGMVVVALLIIGPLLGWRDSNLRHLLKALRWPALAAVIAACIAMVINVRDLLALMYVLLSTFALGTNLVMIGRTLRSGWMRIGGYLAHVGFAVMIIGIIGSSAYATPEERLALSPNDTVSIYGFDFTFNKYDITPEGRGMMDLTVRHGDDVFNARPQLYFNERMGSTMQTPAVKSYIWQDVYISPVEYYSGFDPNNPALIANDSKTIGPYELTFQEFAIDREAMLNNGVAQVGATIKVIYEGQESVVNPVLRVADSSDSSNPVFEYDPVTLPGGHTLTLRQVFPDQNGVLLNIEGLNLPVQTARAVVTVSTKPLVLLVWVGVSVGVLGGLIALLRRYVEGQARLNGERVRLPKGISGLSGRFGWRGTAR